MFGRNIIIIFTSLSYILLIKLCVHASSYGDGAKMHQEYLIFLTALVFAEGKYPTGSVQAWTFCWLLHRFVHRFIGFAIFFYLTGSKRWGQSVGHILSAFTFRHLTLALLIYTGKTQRLLNTVPQLCSGEFSNPPVQQIWKNYCKYLCAFVRNCRGKRSKDVKKLADEPKGMLML